MGNTTRKFQLIHEIGHMVSMLRDAEGDGCRLDYGANEDGCVGDDSAGGHGLLTKAYQSVGGCEGIADFYSALVWNTAGANAACEYVRTYRLDWNLDNTFDVADGAVHSCIDDPFPDNPNLVTDEDWLEDAITNGLGSCGGGQTNRGTQLSWLRYGWDMVTIQGVPVADFWEIWDDTDPHDWSDDDSDAVNWPLLRLETSANNQPGDYDDEHDAAKVRGVDH